MLLAAAAESRRQALATAGRGSTFPLAREDAAARRAAVRTLSAPVPSAAGGGAGSGGAPAGVAAEAAGPAAAAQPDPFRVSVPASAFQIEERRSAQGDAELQLTTACCSECKYALLALCKRLLQGSSVSLPSLEHEGIPRALFGCLL